MGVNVEWNELLGAKGINATMWWVAAEQTVSLLSGNMGRNEETHLPLSFFSSKFHRQIYEGQTSLFPQLFALPALLRMCRNQVGRAGERWDGCGAYGGGFSEPHNGSGT